VEEELDELFFEVEAFVRKIIRPPFLKILLSDFEE
jgi:hypothetical protein